MKIFQQRFLYHRCISGALITSWPSVYNLHAYNLTYSLVFKMACICIHVYADRYDMHTSWHLIIFTKILPRLVGFAGLYILKLIFWKWCLKDKLFVLLNMHSVDGVKLKHNQIPINGFTSSAHHANIEKNRPPEQELMKMYVNKCLTTNGLVYQWL